MVCPRVFHDGSTFEKKLNTQSLLKPTVKRLVTFPSPTLESSRLPPLPWAHLPRALTSTCDLHLPPSSLNLHVWQVSDNRITREKTTGGLYTSSWVFVGVFLCSCIFYFFFFIFGLGRYYLLCVLFSIRVHVSTRFYKASLHSYLIVKYKTLIPFLVLLFYSFFEV